MRVSLIYKPSAPPHTSPSRRRTPQARDYGAYGIGDSLYDAERHAELSYPTALDGVDPALPVHLFIAVGDDEWPNPDPVDARHDLDLVSAQLYNTARHVPGVTAELRILDGGHDWDVWQPALREGIVDIASYLRTEPVAPWDAKLLGTSGDDRAGGLTVADDGTSTVAVNVAASLDGGEHLGGLDVLVIRRAADGTRLWTTQIGDDAAADRIYAVASDEAGGAYLVGYTGGSLDGATSAGDEDVIVGHVTADGAVDWTRQLGRSGRGQGPGRLHGTRRRGLRRGDRRGGDARRHPCRLR